MNGARQNIAMPYKGLIPYDEEDAALFFGRDAEQQLIIANLMASRLTLLFGASGVGKSSLLRAGVAHQLRNQATQRRQEVGSPESAVVLFSSWRDDPVVGLGHAIHASVQQAWAGHSAPTAARRPLVETLEAAADSVEGDLVIILDQFEEYFLYHPHEDGAGTFAVEFPKAVSAAGLRASFLLAIREDAVAKLDRFEGRIPNLFSNYLRIEHLDREAARAAIEQPIYEYNRAVQELGGDEPVAIEPALVDEVLDEVKIGRVVVGEAGRGAIDERSAHTPEVMTERIETPYLQLVMTRLWSEDVAARQHGAIPNGALTIRLETLRSLGGAERIVRTHLDTTMNALADRQQEVAAEAFHYLVTPSGTKIAHSVADLAEYSGLPANEIEPVLETLSGSSARVLLPVAPPLDRPGVVRYEIFHDVLAAAILDWRSRFAQARQLAVERADGEQRLARERRRVWRLRLGLTGLSVLLLGVIALAVFAFQQSEVARTAQRVAFSREVASRAIAQLPSQPDLSLLLSIEAAQLTRTTETEDALRAVLLDPTRAVLRGHTGPLNSIAFSPNGDRLVTASQDGTARIWQASSGKLLTELRGHTRQVTGATFSPDGELVVTASEDNTARLWQASTGAQNAELRGHRVSVGGGAFSDDGRLVVTASDTTAQVWEARSGKALVELVGHTGLVTSVAISRDGLRVVTASLDGTARVWDAISGQVIADLRGHTGSVNSAAFDPDARRVVTASRDQTAKVWDIASNTVLAELSGHSDVVNTAIFSASGDRVVTASDDHTARVWDPTTGRRLAELRGHGGAVTRGSFSPDGRFAITGSTDGVARLWDVSSGELLGELRGHTGRIAGVAFSPDGRFVVTSSEDGTARSWAAITGQSVADLHGHTNGVINGSISRDGARVVTASLDGTARVWDVASGRQSGELRGHLGLVNDALFSPDGTQIATASDDHTARLWTAGTGQLQSVLSEHTGFVNDVAFSPNGQTVVTASWDGTARLWNTATGQSVAVLNGHTGSVEDAVFSADGNRIATASRDGTGRLWDAATGQTLAVLIGHAGPVIAVAFSPDGSRVVTASEDGTARVWSVATGQMLVELRGHGRELTTAAFSPDGSQVLTASEDQTARLWDSQTGGVLTVLRGHSGPLGTATFSPDGKFVVTGSEDRTGRVWDAATGTPIAQLRGATAEVTSAGFGRGSTTIVTTSRDGVARLYTCEPCGSIDELLSIARDRATRALTPSERARYLNETASQP